MQVTLALLPRQPSIVPEQRTSQSRITSLPARPGPVLLQKGVLPRRGYSLLALWHLLSLDAPTVAAVWTWFIACCSGFAMPWTSPAAMFLAVWMLYATDRLLDARVAGEETTDLEERHRFHHRHRARFLAGVGAASVLLTALLPQLPHTELRLFAALGSLLFAYFFLIHLWPTASHIATGQAARLPKELAVGVFFPAAVFIPTVARLPALQIELLPGTLLLAAACTLNCLYVYKWEHPGRPRFAHWTTRYATQHITGLCAATVAACALTVVAIAISLPHSRLLWLPMASGTSAALFLLLDGLRKRLEPVSLRALADAGLLTPLVFAPLLFVFKW